MSATALSRYVARNPEILSGEPIIAPSGQGVRSQEPVVRINLIIKQFFLLIPSLPNRV